MNGSKKISTVSPDDVWLHYDQLIEALEAYQFAVTERMRRGEEVSPIFHDWTIEAVKKNFERLDEELFCWVIMNIITSTEAIVRQDYLQRVAERRKDPLSRIYRALYRTKGNAVRLKDDLLLEWPKVSPSCRVAVNRFIEVLPIRHWIAHGRYYKLRGKLMDIETIRTRIEELLNCGIIAN
jgi:hypothetical protein